MQSLYLRAPAAGLHPTRFSGRVPPDDDESKMVGIMYIEKKVREPGNYYETSRYSPSISSRY